MGVKSRKKKHNSGVVSIVVIVIIFVAVMSVQVLRLKEKDSLLLEREQLLEQQLLEEEARAEELEELEMYTQSVEYIKEMGNKLGLVFENEIIFKENGE